MREQKSCIHTGVNSSSFFIIIFFLFFYLFFFFLFFFLRKKKYMCCVFKKMQKTTAGPELGLRWGMATPWMRVSSVLIFVLCL